MVMDLPNLLLDDSSIVEKVHAKAIAVDIMYAQRGGGVIICWWIFKYGGKNKETFLGFKTYLYTFL